MPTILCVDDEPSVGAILEDALERLGHRILLASHVAEALKLLAAERVDLIISDYRMPGLSGIDFLELLRTEGSRIPLIMITGHGSIDHAVASIKAGAIDYITKPVRTEQLELAVSQALEVVRLRNEIETLRSELSTLRGQRQLVGKSQVMTRLLQTIAMAAPSRATVLIQGESGTGKELVARAIHEASPRRDEAFVQLNCAAIPEGLVESSLFGHEKGAFTGAVKRVEGAFERAHRGTLLLDEVSEMRLDLQAKLLRVLQEQEFERVGGSSPVRVDVRIIATTNRDLAAEAAAGTFRRDLYYRLNVLPISLLPLRDRPEDIPVLAHTFALRAAEAAGKPFREISGEAMQLLLQYPWPGNVRELEHAVERAVILSADEVLQASSFMQLSSPRPADRLAHALLVAETASAHVIDDDVVVLRSLNLEAAERVLIDRALARTGNNRTKAAELLGMSIRTLRSRLNGSPDGPVH